MPGQRKLADNNYTANLGRFAYTLLCALACTACGPQSFKVLGLNIENVEKLARSISIDSPDDSSLKLNMKPASEEDDLHGVSLEMPMAKAQFCLNRALEHYHGYRLTTGADAGMLIMAGVVAGTGSSIGAATAAMDESGVRKDLGIASVTLLAAGGAILGLRSALGLDNVGRTHRIASARNIEAAIRIIESYAMADAPRDVEDNAFPICRDGEIEIARSLPGPASVEAIAQVIEEAGSEKKKARLEAVKATAKVNKSAANVKAAEKIDKEDSTVDSRRELIEQKAAAANAKVELAEAILKEAKADAAAARANVLKATARLRRAVFFETNIDVTMAHGALQDAARQVTKADQAVSSAEQALQVAREQTVVAVAEEPQKEKSGDGT